jgi:hypothetical protein
MTIKKRSIRVWITSIVAVAFGAMTIKEGGSVLFIDGEARQAAGNYVYFVLWFNFIAGFFYVGTGIGIWQEKSWALPASITIAVLTLLIFGAFGFHVALGGEYDTRTVVAMSLRTLVWGVIASITWYQRVPRTALCRY